MHQTEPKNIKTLGSDDNTIKIWNLKDFSSKAIKKEKALLEQQLQAKLDGITLSSTIGL